MKRKVMAVLLAMTMVFSFAGCDSNSDKETTASTTEKIITADTQETDEETKETDEETEITISTAKAGTLVIGNSTENSGEPNPYWANAGSDQDVWNLMSGYPTVSSDQNGKYEYDNTTLAEVVETENEDGTATWTFTINDNLKWSNGETITAEDYVCTALMWASHEVYIDLGASNAAEGMHQYYLGYEAYSSGETDVFEGIHLLSDTSFSITIDAQYVPYYYGKSLVAINPTYMAGWLPGDITIEETENGAKYSNNYSTENIKESIDTERYAPSASAGAYEYVSYDTGSYSYTLKANEEYLGNFEGQTAGIDTIIYKYVGQDTMMDELKTGAIDLLLQVADGSFIDAGLDMVEDGTHGYDMYERNGYGYLVFKCDMGPTQFVEVRRAIAYLLDRVEFAKTFTGGYGAVVNGPYALSQWMTEEAEDDIAALNSYSYSFDNAVTALEAGGWTLDANGKEYNGEGVRYKDVDGELMPLIIEWCTSENNSVSDLLTTMLAQSEDVAAAGIQFNQTVMTFSELQDEYLNDTTGYHMYNLGVGFSVPYVVDFQFAIDGKSNNSHIADEVLADAAANMLLVEEGDDGAFLEIWVQMVQRYNELLPELPLYSNEYHDFFTNRLLGYEGISNGTWEMEDQILYCTVVDK